MAYYLKYRPQTIGELDNQNLRDKLTAILSKEDIPHAWLFTGPKGLGKTSTARIIAKSINCENKKKGEVEPCNLCDMCVSITNGSNIDVLEIDGASNRGIDEIRDLREKVKLSPAKAKKKVYIIDEVHMLTTEAFNALLKTIEEPPKHVVFIFCTTEPHKVLATIVSRCTHISLTRATEEELVSSLKRIVKGEKLEADKKVLEEIAKLSDGGFRDGAKLLEEAVMTLGKTISKEQFEGIYKTANTNSLVQDFFLAFQKRDIKKGLSLVHTLEEQGIDAKFFILQILSHLHQMIRRLTLEEIVVSKDFLQLSLEDIRYLVGELDKAYQQTRYSVIPQLPLEMLVVGWSGEKPIERMSDKPTIKDLYKKEQTLKVQKILTGEEKKEVKKPSTTNINQDNLPVDKAAMDVLMENIIYKVKPFNHSVAGVLRGCSIASVSDEKIVFKTAYKFHKEKLEEAKIRDILEQVVKGITGKQLKVMVELQ